MSNSGRNRIMGLPTDYTNDTLVPGRRPPLRAKDAFAPQYRPTGKQFLSTRSIATIIDRSERDDRAGCRLVTCLELAFVQEIQVRSLVIDGLPSIAAAIDGNDVHVCCTLDQVVPAWCPLGRGIDDDAAPPNPGAIGRQVAG